MNNIEIDIENFLTDIDKSINENITGTNYLEILKKKLADKLNELQKNNSQNLDFSKIDKKKIEKDLVLLNRKFNIKIEYFDRISSNKEQKVEKNTLYLIIEGISTITIYDFEDDKKSIYCKLTKNMGVVLSHNTTISNSIVKKSIVLSISNN